MTAAAFRRALDRTAGVLRAVIGAPDYERYIAHRQRLHPGEEILTPEQFAQERQTARYERPGARCC